MIAYLIPQYPARSHTFIRREIDSLRRRGIDIDVYTVRRCPDRELLTDRERRDRDEAWAILPASLPRVAAAHARGLLRRPARYLGTLRTALRDRNRGARAFAWALFHFTEAIYVSGELRRRGTTHLHVHFATSAAQIGHLAARFLELPWSITLHGACDFEYPAGTVLGPKLETVAFARCVSSYGRSQAMRAIEAHHWPKLFVAHTGIEPALLPPPRTEPKEGTTVQVCMVARLAAEKGHSGLLEAIALCLDGGLDVELTLIGDGPDRPAIEAQVASLGIGAAVHLTGSLSEAEVLERLQAAEVVVLPSLMEGLPVVLMEAMALGVPVIAPRIAGVPELVEHERNGLLFDPSDWAGLADAIRRIAADPAFAAELAAAAPSSVLPRFDIDTAIVALADRLLDADHVGVRAAAAAAAGDGQVGAPAPVPSARDALAER